MKRSPIYNNGIYRIYKAAIYSFYGLKTAFCNEAAFRQDMLLVLILSCIGLYIKDFNLKEITYLIISCFILLIVEILNSAIEWCVDLCTQEINPLAKGAKDMGSAAVFLALCNLIFAFIISIL